MTLAARPRPIKAIWLGGVLLALFGLALCLLWLRLSGNRLLGVQTASMVPTFRPGDALVIKPVKARGLKPGQVITYRNPRNPNILITHRLVKINPRTGWLTTAGDARHSPDPSFSPNLVVGRATLLLPKLGLVIDWLRQPYGLAAIIYLPTASIIVSEARRLIDAYTRPIYSVRL